MVAICEPCGGTGVRSPHDFCDREGVTNSPCPFCAVYCICGLSRNDHEGREHPFTPTQVADPERDPEDAGFDAATRRWEESVNR